MGALLGDDGGDPGLQDAGLFVSDGGDALAKPGFMVEVDGGDDAECGADEVGGVEPTAEANFDDGAFDLALGEDIEGHQCDGLEVRRVGFELSFVDQAFRDRMNGGKGVGKLGATDWLAADLDPLGGLDEVRGGVQAGLHAGCADSGFDQGAGGAFAVGAGDVDDGRLGVGKAHGLPHDANLLQAEFG